MILDTSAAVALLRNEPEADLFLDAIEAADQLGMSVASVLELAIVTRASGPDLVDDFLDDMGIRSLGVDAEQLRWARHAFGLYGRGSGSPARLNFGDCFSYAAAKATGRALLFKGDDFTHTDVRRAIPG